MSDNNCADGMGCIVLIALIWFFFCGGCSAIMHWTHEQNDKDEVKK